MREMPKEIQEDLEGGAREGIKVMREYLTYQGDNPKYEKKAKVGGILVSSYTRAFASITNRAMVELARQRMMADEPEKKRLKSNA